MASRAHSKVNSSIAFGYFVLKALLIHPAVMRLYRRDVSYVVILIPETADVLSL